MDGYWTASSTTRAARLGDARKALGLGTDAARLFGTLLSSDDRRGCLAEPSAEPILPQDGLRTRP